MIRGYIGSEVNVKSLLWKFIQYHFKFELERLKNVTVNENSRLRQLENQEMQRKCVEYEFPIGSKIFVIPNHPGELIIGEVVGYEDITQAKRRVVKYKDFRTGDLGFYQSPVHWNPELEKAIRNLKWWERWNICHPNSNPYLKEDIQKLEEHLKERYGRRD